MGTLGESKARAFVVFGLFTLGVVALTGASGLRTHDAPPWSGADQVQGDAGAPTHTDGGHDEDGHSETSHTETSHTDAAGGGNDPDEHGEACDEPGDRQGDNDCDATSTTTTTATSTTTTSTTTTSTTSTTTAPATTTTITTTTTHRPRPPAPTTPPLSFTFEVQGSDDGAGGAGTAGDLTLGEQITVTGRDLPPGSHVKVEIHSATRLLGWSVVQADGAFTLTTVIPSDLGPGAHTIVVTVYPPGGAAGQESLTIPVTSGAPQEVVLGAYDPGAPPDVGPPSRAARAPGPGLDDPTVFGSSLKTVDDIHLTPSSAGVIGGVAAAFLLLFAFPAEILRLTLLNNDRRVRRMVANARARARRAAPRLSANGTAVARGFRTLGAWITRARRAVAARVPVLRSDWAQVLAAAAVGAVILAFADPEFGLHGSSARLLVAMFLSILWVVVTMNTVVRLFAARRFHTVARFTTMPFALLFMVVGVIASRLTHSHPGFVIGLVMGVTYARELRRRDEAELALVGAGTFLGIGLISWLAFSRLSAGGAHEQAGFWFELFREVFAAGALESLVALVVGLLPMTFLEGRPIFEWSRKVWAAVYAVALVTFMVLIVPISGDFRQTRGNLAVLLTGLLVFSAVALAVWYGFRVAERRDREGEAAAEAEAAASAAARSAGARVGRPKAPDR